MSNWPHILESEDIRFAPNQKLPPGYRVVRCDDHAVWLAPDGITIGYIHWDRWASWRGAWAHYRKALAAKENP